MELTGKDIAQATKKDEEDDGPAIAFAGLGFLLLVAAVITLHLYDGSGWVGWTAVVAGVLGVISVAVGGVLAAVTKDTEAFSFWSVIGMVLVAGKFVTAALDFLS